ncbi:glycosyltransferase family 39 protein [Actinoplanes sp. RD1]|uniref:glycosyltransferase family 39 protein n=1 Tax=Actinoplanes sp. RD1 TaxID=3064538 RepID=UPI002740719C|nr:glycosyltransferase family 39 protein [Actinoplanes sp. RD1]
MAAETSAIPGSDATAPPAAKIPAARKSRDEAPAKDPVVDDPPVEDPAEDSPAAEDPAEDSPAAEDPAEDSPAEDSPAAAEPPPKRKRAWRLWQTLGLTLPPFALTLAVMLVGIGNRQLWRDENATWWAATLTLDDLDKLTDTVDVVLRPYYLLMHWWIGVYGDSETALRVPSALFMALSAPVVALIGRRLFEPRAGLAAGLLVAVLPVVSRYGQEARPYAMAMLATVTAVWLLLRALERPTVLRWFPYAVAVAWIACSHVVALTSLAAHVPLVVAALIRRKRSDQRDAGPDEQPAEGRRKWFRGTGPRRPRLRILIGWPVAVLAGVGAMVPLILEGQGQNGQIAWIPDTTWERVREFPGEVFMSPGVAGFVLVAGLIALVGLASRRPGTALALALWTVLPPVAAYYTFHEFHFFFPRYMLFTVPAWVLLAAYALTRVVGSDPAARLWRPVTAQLLAAVLVAGGALTFFGWHQQGELRSDMVEDEIGYRAAAAYIAERDEPGDGVVYTGYAFLHRGFRYYWRDLPVADQPREILVQQAAGAEWNWVHDPCLDTVACLGETPRIWLISSDPSGKPLWPLPPGQQEAIAERYEVVTTTTFHRLWVSELVRRPAG